MAVSMPLSCMVELCNGQCESESPSLPQEEWEGIWMTNKQNNCMAHQQYSLAVPQFTCIRHWLRRGYDKAKTIMVILPFLAIQRIKE